MEKQTFCQSCSMPLNKPELLGTEKDGTKSTEYCKFCYQNGAFINADMNLEGMKALVKAKMEEMHIDKDIVARSMSSLPHLRRWNATAANQK